MYKRFGYLKTDAQTHTKNPLIYEDLNNRLSPIRFIKQKAYISIIMDSLHNFSYLFTYKIDIRYFCSIQSAVSS